MLSRTGLRRAARRRRPRHGLPHSGTGHDQVGSLIGVYDVRWNSSVDLQERIDIGVSRSTDKGQTWEPMRIAMSFADKGGLPAAQNGVGDPAVLVDENTGTIWVVAVWAHGMGNGRATGRTPGGIEPIRTPQLMMVRSDDDGRTWSDPVNVTGQVKVSFVAFPAAGTRARDNDA